MKKMVIITTNKVPLKGIVKEWKGVKYKIRPAEMYSIGVLPDGLVLELMEQEFADVVEIEI